MSSFSYIFWVYSVRYRNIRWYFARSKLSDANANLRLSLFTILAQFNKEHQSGVFRFGEPLLNLDRIPIVPFVNKFLPDFEYRRPEIVEAGVHLTGQPVATRCPFFCLIPLCGIYMALNVNFAFQSVGSNSRQNGCETVLPILLLRSKNKSSMFSVP